jgi:DoxX-like family
MGNRNRSGGSTSLPGDALHPYTKPARKDAGMETRTEPSAIASRYRSTRWRSVGYWLATAVVTGELALGGIWDIARIPFVADLVRHLGYPSYFLVLLGSWKVLAAVALLIPRRPLLKEWAYAGAFFTYTGAIVSHLATGYDLAEVGLLAVLTALTVLSWALRPPSRRTSRRTPAPPLAAAMRDTAGVAHTTAVIGHSTPGSGEAAAGAATPRKER